MALILCEDCGREVSERAQSCPSCGCPTGGFHINTSASTPLTPAQRYAQNGGYRSSHVTTELTSKPIKLGMLITALITIGGGVAVFNGFHTDHSLPITLMGLCGFLYFRFSAWWNHG